MPTDPALLAQLQAHWNRPAVTIVLPATSTPRPPESTAEPPAREQSEFADDHQQQLDEGQDRDQDRFPWVLAENAVGQIGIERNDVPLESRWWRVATFDCLPYADACPPDIVLERKCKPAPPSQLPIVFDEQTKGA